MSLPVKSDWVAIPSAALAVAGRDPQRRSLVMGLYEFAHATGYAERTWTERDLAFEHGVDRSVVTSVLEALARIGLLELRRAAPRTRKPSSLRVWPASARMREELRSSDDRQTCSQNNRRTPPMTEVRQPGGDPPRAEAFARALGGDRDGEIDRSPQPPSGGQTQPTRNAPDTVPPAPARKRRRKAREVPPEQLALVFEARAERAAAEEDIGEELRALLGDQAADLEPTAEERARRRAAQLEADLVRAARGDPALVEEIWRDFRAVLEDLGVTRRRALLPLLVDYGRARAPPAVSDEDRAAIRRVLERDGHGHPRAGPPTADEVRDHVALTARFT